MVVNYFAYYSLLWETILNMYFQNLNLFIFFKDHKDLKNFLKAVELLDYHF